MSDFKNIVISSRIRLARNFKDVLFPTKLADYDEAMAVVKGVYAVLKEYGEFDFHKIKNLNNLKSLILLEENKISRDLIENKDISAVAIDEENNLTVMINEEDHIRMQCVTSGFNLQKAYDIITELDEVVLENLKIAYDKDLGFITSAPTNLGTGMRASVMLFLPGITMKGKIDTLGKQASMLGLTVRGKFGENSAGEGYVYQISNESTLGMSEEQILQNVINVTLKICEMEQAFLQDIMQEKEDEIIDLVSRAVGILTNSHMLTSQEAIKLLSRLKLGANLSIINLKNKDVIDNLLQNIQPAHLLDSQAKELNQKQRNIYRAKYVKNILNQELKV